MDTIFDQSRKKDVALTPEERVRQWFVDVLISQVGIHAPLIATEVPLKYGQKSWRADIVVYRSGTLDPHVMVECKRPEVRIDAEVLQQALRYNAVLKARYIILTNGNQTVVWDCSCSRQLQWSEFISIWNMEQGRQ